MIGDRLPELLDAIRPQLVLYNAGVDAHRDDRLGRLDLSDEGLMQRDRLVLDACLRRPDSDRNGDRRGVRHA